MIYKVYGNEHFNLTLVIVPKEPGGCKRAEIDMTFTEREDAK